MHTVKGQPLENGSQSSAPCASCPSDDAPENTQSRAVEFCESPESVTSDSIRPSAGNVFLRKY